MPRPLVFCCSQARTAHVGGDLVWSDWLHAWTLATVPLRRVSWRARYQLAERDARHHDGEPYTYSHCPFCGGPLPFADLSSSTSYPQGDGGEGAE